MAMRNTDITKGTSYIQHTKSAFLRGYRGHSLLNDMRHDHLFNLTCDVGGPPSRAPIVLGLSILYRFEYFFFNSEAILTRTKMACLPIMQ